MRKARPSTGLDVKCDHCPSVRVAKEREANISVSNRRQLLIGLDAMEWNLVKEWAMAGHLPTFRRLLEEGAHAELSTTSAQLPDTIWASIYTGVNPAKFEKYFYIQYDRKTQGLRNVPDDAIRRKPFWDYLTDEGRKVCVVDVPKFPLSSSINGCQLTNWGAHATKTARASNPPELLSEIDARFGPHPVGDCDGADAKPEPLRRLRQKILDGVARHGELFRWLMKRYEWDIFFAGFSAPHCIGHHFWHWIDPTHPEHTQADPCGLTNSIQLVYQVLDREIGAMLELAGEDTHVILFAGHGMGPLYHASWNLPEMLEMWGYGTKPATRGNEVHDARVNPWRLLKMAIPGKVQYGIKNLLPKRMQDELLFRWYRGGRHWKGWHAFAVPNNDSTGAIRINVRGRDHNGIVESAEYDQLCNDIRQALLELTDPVSGRLVVKRVTILKDEFHGPFIDQLPDLTVLWEQSFPWHSVHSPRFGTLRIRQQDSRTGSHTDHGFLLMHGPDVPAGSVMTGCSVYDIAPTVLTYSGIRVPEDFDGHPIP